METPIFEQIATALTVRQICSPLGPDLPWSATDHDLNDMTVDEGLDPFNNPSRVVGPEGVVLGIVWFEDYHLLGEEEEGPQTVGDVMQPLGPSEFLSAGTSILDAVNIFAESSHRLFYVIEKNEVVGVLYYSDLFKPLGRLAFLALALEIEDLALALCRAGPVKRSNWWALSENRRGKAVELFQRRYGRQPNVASEPADEAGIFSHWGRSDFDLLIGSTNLVDKAVRMSVRCGVREHRANRKRRAGLVDAPTRRLLQL